MLQSRDWALFRNMTYSIARVLHYVANENAKGMFVKKEAVVGIIVNITYASIISCIYYILNSVATT